MAKIEESITYKGRICSFIKCIGHINFYTYSEENDEEVGNLLLVNKTNKEVIANIAIDYGYGAYGIELKGYIIEKE